MKNELVPGTSSWHCAMQSAGVFHVDTKPVPNLLTVFLYTQLWDETEKDDVPQSK